jgi:hypothetical protein
MRPRRKSPGSWTIRLLAAALAAGLGARAAHLAANSPTHPPADTRRPGWRNEERGMRHEPDLAGPHSSFGYPRSGCIPHSSALPICCPLLRPDPDPLALFGTGDPPLWDGSTVVPSSPGTLSPAGPAPDNLDTIPLPGSFASGPDPGDGRTGVDPNAAALAAIRAAAAGALPVDDAASDPSPERDNAAGDSGDPEPAPGPTRLRQVPDRSKPGPAGPPATGWPPDPLGALAARPAGLPGPPAAGPLPAGRGRDGGCVPRS